MEKNITWKTLLEKLVLITIIILFVNMYSGIFGNENTLIGVTVITVALMFCKIDMGYKLKESIAISIILFTYITFIASLNNLNIYLSLGLNLLSIFVVMYLSCEVIDTKAYLGFILQYVFMDGSSIATSALLNRVLAGFIGGLILAIVLWITRKSKEPNEKSVIDIFRNKTDFTSERFRFSIKMALGISMAIFIGRIIGTQKGMWISIAVMSITQPNFTESKQRFKDRFISTLIGAIMFVLLFKVLVKEPQHQVYIMLILGYIYTFIYKYRIKMIFVANNALVAAMVIFGTLQSITLRVAFLILGIGLVYLISKFEEIMLTKRFRHNQIIN